MVQEQRDLLQHGLARRPFLHDQHLRQFARVLLLWAAEAFSPVDHELHLGSCFGLGDPPEQLDRAHVAQGGTQEHAVEGRGAQRLEHPCSQAGRSDLYPRAAQAFLDVRAARVIAVGHQQRLGVALDEIAYRQQSLTQRFGNRLLAHHRHGAQVQALACLIRRRHHAYGDVPGLHAVLQPLQDHPAIHVRESHGQRDRIRPERLSQCQSGTAIGSNDSLESVPLRDVEQCGCEPGVVLHDQRDVIAGIDIVAVVVGLRPAGNRRVGTRPLCGLLRGQRAGRRRFRAHGRRRCPVHGRFLRQGEIEHESAAPAWRTLDRDLAPEQPRQLPADRQPETGATVTAAGGTVRLLESLEDDLLLVRRDTDAAVRDHEGNHLCGRVQLRAPRRPAALGGHDSQLYSALGGELESVRQQVLQNPLQALLVGLDHRGQARIDADCEIEVLL